MSFVSRQHNSTILLQGFCYLPRFRGCPRGVFALFAPLLVLPSLST